MNPGTDFRSIIDFQTVVESSLNLGSLPVRNIFPSIPSRIHQFIERVAKIEIPVIRHPGCIDVMAVRQQIASDYKTIANTRSPMLNRGNEFSRIRSDAVTDVGPVALQSLNPSSTQRKLLKSRKRSEVKMHIRLSQDVVIHLFNNIGAGVMKHIDIITYFEPFQRSHSPGSKDHKFLPAQSVCHSNPVTAEFEIGFRSFPTENQPFEAVVIKLVPV